MDISKTLRRPSNWQDFESLCKKLWGEIWNCSEIKKNGRAGQTQHGVDIYGIPSNEIQYFGIQCKGKDEYQDKGLSEVEISKEILKAQSFIPALKKLYFATTAVKDAKIEEFVRKLNVENKSKGLFEVQIYSWEDIVDLIDENKQTHDWYVNNQNYIANKSVLVSFKNGSTKLFAKPKFKKVIKEYGQKIIPADPYLNPLAFFNKQLNPVRTFNFPSAPFSNPKLNLSFIELGINIQNTGTDTIEDFQLILEFSDKVTDIDYTNESGGLAYIQSILSHLIITKNPVIAKIHPKDGRLVSEATFVANTFYIKPAFNESLIIIKWKFLSKDFKDNGELLIEVKPTVEIENKLILLDINNRKPPEEGPVEDFMIDI